MTFRKKKTKKAQDALEFPQNYTMKWGEKNLALMKYNERHTSTVPAINKSRQLPIVAVRYCNSSITSRRWWCRNLKCWNNPRSLYTSCWFVQPGKLWSLWVRFTTKILLSHVCAVRVYNCAWDGINSFVIALLNQLHDCLTWVLLTWLYTLAF